MTTLKLGCDQRVRCKDEREFVAVLRAQAVDTAACRSTRPGGGASFRDEFRARGCKLRRSGPVRRLRRVTATHATRSVERPAQTRDSFSFSVYVGVPPNLGVRRLAASQYPGRMLTSVRAFRNEDDPTVPWYRTEATVNKMNDRQPFERACSTLFRLVGTHRRWDSMRKRRYGRSSVRRLSVGWLS